MNELRFIKAEIDSFLRMKGKHPDFVFVPLGWLRAIRFYSSVGPFYCSGVEILESTYVSAPLATGGIAVPSSGKTGAFISAANAEGSLVCKLTPYKPKSCECGADKVGSSMHSTWCSLN